MEQVIIVVVLLVISLLNWLFRQGPLKGLFGPPEEDQPTPPDDFEVERRARPMAPQRPQPTRPVQSAEEEKVRKFLEALGLPPEAVPPPVAQEPRRQAQPAPRQIPPPLPSPAPYSAPKVPRPMARPVVVPARSAQIPARAAPATRAVTPMETRATVHFPGTGADSGAEDAAVQAMLEKGAKREAFTQDAYRTQASGGEAAGKGVGYGLRGALAAAGGARKAILLREILGPPVGLSGLAGSVVPEEGRLVTGGIASRI